MASDCAAIIVACLASFRTLYTRSVKRYRASPNSDPSGNVRIFQGESKGLSGNSREGNTTQVTANSHTYKLQPHLSSTSSEERILPLSGVYVHHEFSVLPDHATV